MAHTSDVNESVSVVFQRIQCHLYEHRCYGFRQGVKEMTGCKAHRESYDFLIENCEPHMKAVQMEKFEVCMC